MRSKVSFTSSAPLNKSQAIRCWPASVQSTPALLYSIDLCDIIDLSDMVCVSVLKKLLWSEKKKGTEKVDVRQGEYCHPNPKNLILYSTTHYSRSEDRYKEERENPQSHKYITYERYALGREKLFVTVFLSSQLHNHFLTIFLKMFRGRGWLFLIAKGTFLANSHSICSQLLPVRLIINLVGRVTVSNHLTRRLTHSNLELHNHYFFLTIFLKIYRGRGRLSDCRLSALETSYVYLLP